MKMLSINRLSAAALSFLFAVVLYSCQKEDGLSNSQEVTEQEAVTYSEESSEAEASFDDVADVAMTAADEEGNASEYGENGRGFFPTFSALREIVGDCATVTVTPNDSTYPKTVTIDFGDGCWGHDGKFRKGAIVLHFTAPLRRPGSVLTITFRNFYLNRAHLEGTKIISNLSEPPHHKWSVQVVGGKVTYPSGRGYKFEGLKVKTQIEGMDTRNCRDDVYKIEGRSKTEFNNGLSITLNTETPLIKKVACRWISDGTLKIKINDRVLFLDYGFPHNGDCDNKALLTWNDGQNQRVITLP
jgi:hypothetical protein